MVLPQIAFTYPLHDAKLQDLVMLTKIWLNQKAEKTG